jgi:uncharacterized protein YuzE
MAAKLTFRYDKVGDILYIDKVKPYAEQDQDELGDEISARFNPNTGLIETVEILFFKRRLEAGEDIVLPVDADLRLAIEA